MPTPAAQEGPIHFGKYRLLERLATGGMAELYRATWDAPTGLTRPLVIKKILPHFADDPAFVLMFVTEARIVARLSHDNIAQVFDFGEVKGDWFLALELVDGQPLSKVIRRARERGLKFFPVPTAVWIAMQVARGLHYAHTRVNEFGKPLEIVHRDVSPQNLLLSWEGQVKIVDFGIAKARLAGRLETQAGAVKGKYVYFAPEQARGKTLDARTDVFALGVVLYELVCGRLPCEGKLMDVMRKIVQSEFPRPRELNADLPEALERILLKALANDPAHRYATAAEFHDALARFLELSAPHFSAKNLSNLVQHLYQAELAAEGRPVQLPPDFDLQRDARRAPVHLPPPLPTVEVTRVEPETVEQQLPITRELPEQTAAVTREVSVKSAASPPETLTTFAPIIPAPHAAPAVDRRSRALLIATPLLAALLAMLVLTFLT